MSGPHAVQVYEPPPQRLSGAPWFDERRSPLHPSLSTGPWLGDLADMKCTGTTFYPIIYPLNLQPRLCPAARQHPSCILHLGSLTYSYLINLRKWIWGRTFLPPVKLAFKLFNKLLKQLSHFAWNLSRLHQLYTVQCDSHTFIMSSVLILE